jgi:hypothetical protein
MLASAELSTPRQRHGSFFSASELKHVGLTEALELCLLLADKAPERFGRAALRWHGRYCREFREVGLAEGQAVLATLAALEGARRRNSALALAELLSRRGLERLRDTCGVGGRGPRIECRSLRCV